MNEIAEGVLHITDLEGYDHMLYLFAMSAPFLWKDYKKIILLATAFTVGHSLTLLASAAGWFAFSSTVIEMLISVSIALTALLNFIWNKPQVSWWNSTITVGFGLIHGMGFSSYFKMMFDQSESWILKLLFFNIGIEVGQLLIIGVIVLLGFLATSVVKVPSSTWSRIVAGIAFVVSCYLIIDKI
jgi:hypothetical protein